MFTKAQKCIAELGLTIPSPRVLANGRMLVTNEQRRMMVWLYEGGYSTWKIAKAFGYLNVCVMNNLRKAGVEFRNRSDANKHFEVDRHYFDKMDTHEKAYILGLIYADGNLSKDSFTLALQEGDEYILEAIKKEIQFTGPINVRKAQRVGYKRMFALRVHDQAFCDSLRKLNIFERKTTKVSFPSFLESQFHSSFLHGLLDGDGWVSFTNQKTLETGIAGSPIIIPQVAKLLSKEIKVNLSVKRSGNSNGWKGTCSSIQGLRFLDYIYSDKKRFCLKRKHAKFLQALSYYIERDQAKLAPKYLPLLKEIANRHLHAS